MPLRPPLPHTAKILETIEVKRQTATPMEILHDGTYPALLRITLPSLFLMQTPFPNPHALFGHPKRNIYATAPPPHQLTIHPRSALIFKSNTAPLFG